MDPTPLQRGDIIKFTRQEMNHMTLSYLSHHTQPSLTKRQVLYAIGLREHPGIKGVEHTCVVIYPKKFLVAKLKYGF